MAPKISIVISSLNRADLLAAALDSFMRQTFATSDFEALVIDNGSADHTTQVIRTYMTKLPNLLGLYDAEPGLHTGRHVGMKAAKGDILVFADDDIEAFPSWLSSIKEGFSGPDVAMVGGNNFPMFLEEPPSWLQKMWERRGWGGVRAIPALSVIEFSGQRSLISPYQIWGCNFAIRKDVLLAAGGFHPDGMPKELIRFRGDGETHVSRYVAESGMKCVFHAGASVYHKVTPERMTYTYFRQRGFNQGVSDSYTVLRNEDQPSSGSQRSSIARAASWSLRKFRDIMCDHEMKQALQEIKLGHREGYAYHQKVYREDPEVRAWVHKPTYF